MGKQQQHPAKAKRLIPGGIHGNNEFVMNLLRSVCTMIISQAVVDITRLEEEIFKFVCQWGCTLLQQALESYDNTLMLERNRTEYRHKGKRQTVYKTVMGEVVYERALYEYKRENNQIERVFLLDKAMGKPVCGKISQLLAEKIAEISCEVSYRKTAEAIRSMTGQSISHGGAWDVAQALGKQSERQECKNTRLAKKNQGNGEQETKLLFEEQDGIWLNLQGKDREKRGSSIEMKVAIAYEGAKKTGKDRFNLSGKVACANFEASGAFYDRKEGAIAAKYNVDEIELRIMNADGANWCKRSLVDDTVHYQLDTFHRNKAILRYVSDPDARKLILKLLYSKQIDTLLDVIEAYSNSTEDEKERENYLNLLKYFQNNREGLILYKRRGLDLPEPPKDIEYRNCGGMESNIFSLIGRRMKRNRTNWSIRGGNNMARLLCLKATGQLSSTLFGTISMVLPEKYSQTIETTLSSVKIPQRIGKGYNGFAQASIPLSQGWMKDLFAFKPIFG
jgi:hypothetical protein